MATEARKAWFVPKRYGYGSTPASWQGWAATAVFIAVFVLDVTLLRGWTRWVCGTLAIGVFASVACAKTSGGCRWRWGKP
jgi:hypothetical protein